MAFTLSSKDARRMIEWAQQADPHECCGLLFGNDVRAFSAELTANVSPTPTTHFEIDPARLIAAEKAARDGGPAIAGYFHSHPRGQAKPSAVDADMAAQDGRIWLIISNGEITAWRKTNSEGFGPIELEFADGPRIA